MPKTEVSLIEFINAYPKIKENLDTCEVQRIIALDKAVDEKFLKWDISTEEPICIGCCGCFENDDARGSDSCEQIELSYYVSQHCTSMEGDSFSGTMVYCLIDCFVEVNFSC